MEKKPVLSIGVIFKNEARCLERCLRALQPLREALPCELVMADTGSGDGSREIAGRYADVLFDFPWTDDFAAARNAVLDHSSGEWFLTVDADEWLDGDISELLAFFRSKEAEQWNLCYVTVRNYRTYEPDSAYSDFYAARMVRVSGGMRYVGAIHEHWNFPKEYPGLRLQRTVFHHDGYVELYADTELGKAKRERNIRLLREELERNPENLMAYLQFLDSGQSEPDCMDVLRRAVGLTVERKENWEIVGPAILRVAVMYAVRENRPEAREWIALSEELFPDSAFTCVDTEFYAFAYFLRTGESEEAVRRGERYLWALEEDRAGRLDPNARIRCPLQMDTLEGEQTARIVMADFRRKEGRPEEALSLVTGLDYARLATDDVEKLARLLMNLQLGTRADTAALMRSVWEGLGRPVPDRAKADARMAVLLEAALPAFSGANRAAEREQEGFFRHTYTLFLPLAEECDLGRAAAVLEAADAGEARLLLAGVERWDALPPGALARALELGTAFPLEERPLLLEEMDGLAAGLAREGEALYGILRRAAAEDFAGSWQTLAWVRALALAAVRACGWEDEARGLALARTFGKVEGAFLTGCYAPEVLREGNLFVLPSMHRFGWYCAQAFAALEAGDAADYARLLRAGLESNPAMKPMVEFLTKHTPELQAPGPGAELLALAEKVKALLAAYPAGDPAVLAVKASPAYQRVAYLIEGDSE